jgi:hypothetical protein
MDSFYKIVIVVAIVVFIITMTIVGILMSNTYVGVSYPPTSGKCPDYWTMQQIGSGSSIHNVCNIPSPNSTNIGSIYNNQSNFANGTPGITGMTSVNFADNGWSKNKKSICAQKTWANTYSLNWDGVSNYNGCT